MTSVVHLRVSKMAADDIFLIIYFLNFKNIYNIVVQTTIIAL